MFGLFFCRQRRHCPSIRASVTERTEEVPLADLQVMLEDAVRQEDYQTAARLRDELMCATESNPTCALLQQSVQVLQLTIFHHILHSTAAV